MTRQGLRDLNYYGPKRPTVAPDAPKSVTDAPSVPATLAVPEVVAAETVSQVEIAGVSNS